MCLPAAAIGPLMIASTAVTAAGQLQSGLYASRQAQYSAQVAQQNKGLAREGAVDAIARGQDEQRRLGREVAQRVGSQEARMGANNIDVTSGSAARVIEDTRMIGGEDAAAVAENARREVRSMQIDAWGYENERRMQLAERRQAGVATAFGMASTALGGATQYAKFAQQFADPLKRSRNEFGYRPKSRTSAPW